MYSYDWDPSTGGYILNSTPLKFSKEPRPVYYKELDILGFDRYWDYEKDDTYPYMWAEANTYWYRGRKVAQTKGGSCYEAPEIILNDEAEPAGQKLRFVDIPTMVKKNELIMEGLVQETIKKVYNTYVEYLGNFAVRQHLRYVEQYANPDNYNSLTYEDTLLMAEELAPLITPDEDEASAVRFDALMYGIELAYLAGKKYSRARTDLYKKVSGIASVANIPEIMVQSELINKILHTDYLDTAGINEFEHIRENLRDLMKYIPRTGVKYITNFDDEILSVEWNESDLESDDLKNYKAKAEFYIRQHQDEAAIAKLKSNVPLSAEDVKALERILWSEVGSKKDYEAEYGEKPLGEFVREIVGLDMTAAKAAFAEYLNDVNLDADQIYFVNQIIEYIVRNGVMKDMSVLQEPPFTDRGSIVEVFTDISIWLGIRSVIEKINANAAA